MSGAEGQPRSSKTEHPVPAPEEPGTASSTLRGVAKFLGGSLGCLLFLALAAVAAVGVLAIFLDDPLMWIAVVALLVALSARKTAKALGKR